MCEYVFKFLEIFSKTKGSMALGFLFGNLNSRYIRQLYNINFYNTFA